jgi:hypothetical protein
MMPLTNTQTHDDERALKFPPGVKPCFGIDLGGTLCKICYFEKAYTEGEAAEETAFREKMKEIVFSQDSYGTVLGFYHGFYRVRVSLIGSWLVRCSVFGTEKNVCSLSLSLARSLSLFLALYRDSPLLFPGVEGAIQQYAARLSLP